MTIKNPEAVANHFISLLNYKVIEKYNEKVDALVVKNCSLGGSPLGFISGNKTYPENSRMYLLNVVHESLEDEIIEIDNENQDRIDKEAILYKVFMMLLSRCNTLEDIRNAFPEVIVRLHDDFNNIPRTKPEGYVTEGNDSLYRQYLKARDIAEEFSMDNLIMG